MIVARQFIAWIVPDERNRPVGYGMIVAWQGGLAILCDRFFVFLQSSSSQHRTSGVTMPHTVPPGPVGLCDGFRAFFGGSARVQAKKRFVLGFSGGWEQRSAEAFERSLSLGQFAEVKG